jgi:cytochrome P450
MVLDRDAELNLTNLFRPEILADPYPFYHRLRTHDPVHWDRNRAAWVLTRHADVLAVATDPRFSSERWERDASWIPEPERVRLGSSYLALGQEMLFCDPPEHTRSRARIGRAFTHWLGGTMQPRAEQIVHALLDAVQHRGRMDVLRDLAYPFPFLVMAAILNLPRDDHSRLRQWSDAHGKLIGMRHDRLLAAVAGFHELKEYFRGLAAQRRASPGDDLISALIALEDGEDCPCSEESLANCALLLTAAHESTTNMLANGILALLRHPDQMSALRDNPALMPSAVEELLRFDGPVQITSRAARADVDVAGKSIAEGQMVLLLLGAANRDPEAFAEPDRLDLARRENRHLAFSHGIHYCLGASLARLEGQVFFRAVLDRLPGLQLERPTVEWDRNPTMRSLKALQVTF